MQEKEKNMWREEETKVKERKGERSTGKSEQYEARNVPKEQ